MFDIALSVLSCLRADTEVHAAWIVSEAGSAEAVALTPGGGRMGSLLEGALDHTLAEAIPGLGDTGGLVDVSLGPVESLVSGLPQGTTLTIAVLPGRALPTDVWDDLAAKRPVAFALGRDGTRFTGAQRVDDASGNTTLTEDRLTCSFVPVPRVVISGGGPIAEALAQAFAVIGWRPSVIPDVGGAAGVMATLSPLDAVVVMGHDVETSGRSLQAAIGSSAGYIASIGSVEMQELRRQWLSFRGVDWDERVHGPAGLPIGASNPGEIAISIVAEAVAASRLDGEPPGG
ncbi:MAG TPA: XdhC family protein [Acidimicrobiia bacterium]|nr:XdhC family protein [Acidimicrobiia bacterium]